MSTKKRKLCPFRKKTIYINNLTGSGRPKVDHTTEIFCECIGKDCMAYYIAWAGMAMEHPACRCMEGDC